METTIIQVAVKEWQNVGDPDCPATVTFSVRMPKDVWCQEFNVSTLKYGELLDRCWEVTKKRILEYYKEKVDKDSR